jgi:hypothetical protein
MTVDVSLTEAELELLLVMVDRVLRPRRRQRWPTGHKITAAWLFAKLEKAHDGMPTALMRAGEGAGE